MKNEFQVIAELIEKNKKVLDVGCGEGYCARKLIEMSWPQLGIVSLRPKLSEMSRAESV